MPPFEELPATVDAMGDELSQNGIVQFCFVAPHDSGQHQQPQHGANAITTGVLAADLPLERGNQRQKGVFTEQMNGHPFAYRPIPAVAGLCVATFPYQIDIHPPRELGLQRRQRGEGGNAGKVDFLQKEAILVISDRNGGENNFRKGFIPSVMGQEVVVSGLPIKFAKGVAKREGNEGAVVPVVGAVGGGCCG